MKMVFLNILVCFLYRMQEKHVKEKQCEHQRHIIELQEKLKKNQNSVRTTYIYLYMHSHSNILHVYCWSWVKGKKILLGVTVCWLEWRDILTKRLKYVTFISQLALKCMCIEILYVHVSVSNDSCLNMNFGIILLSSVHVYTLKVVI